MSENARRGRQARNFTTNVPKILVLKSSSEQIFSRKLPLGAPALCADRFLAIYLHLKYQELVTYKRVAAVVVSIWVISALISLIR